MFIWKNSKRQTPLLQSTAKLHSDLPPSDQQLIKKKKKTLLHLDVHHNMKEKIWCYFCFNVTLKGNKQIQVRETETKKLHEVCIAIKNTQHILGCAV